MGMIQNRIDMKYYLACVNCNPNGDPDMGNMPRTYADTGKGYITRQCTTSRIRDYVKMVAGNQPGMSLFMERSTNLNVSIAAIKTDAGVALRDETVKGIEKTRQKACATRFDVRSFGAVMNTGPKGGQVRGPVCVTYGVSLDPVDAMEIGITRCATSKDAAGDKAKKFTTLEEYIASEEGRPAEQLRTMGRFQFIPFGLYEIHVFISPLVAQQTGFSDTDMKVLFRALTEMYDTIHSASKGEMYLASPLILFKHNGDPTRPEEEQYHQRMIGCGEAHRLFDLVKCQKKEGIVTPESYRDYTCTVDFKSRPALVDIGFLVPYADDIVWNRLPDGETWMTEA